MRKFFVSLLVFCLISLPAFSMSLDDLKGAISKLPELKQGLGYSFLDSDFHYLSTAEIVSYKNFTLEAGMSFKQFEGDDTDRPNMPIVVIGYDIVKLRDLGVKIPILDKIEANLGIYAGCGRIGSGGGNNEFDYGASLTIINLDF
jgi:hypothetical protein